MTAATCRGSCFASVDLVSGPSWKETDVSVALLGEEDVETLERIPMSYEEYLALPERPRHEWVDGVAVVAAAPLPRHQLAVRALAVLLDDELAELIVLDGVAVALPGDRERIPDITVVTALPAGRRVVDTPVLVVEVLSQSTRSEDLLRKPPEYLEAGIAHYWVVDVDARTIEVHVNADGLWQLLVTLDDAHPAAEVDVAGHGTVAVDLRDVLR